MGSGKRYKKRFKFGNKVPVIKEKRKLCRLLKFGASMNRDFDIRLPEGTG